MRIDKARREALGLVVVVFLLGVFMGGIGNHLWGARVWGMKATSPRAEIIAQVDHDVNLSPEQQKELGAIIDQTQVQLRDVYASADAQREKIRLGSHTEIRAILTPEQQPKYDEFVRRIEEQRKKNATPAGH